jgi:hypothetical protein
LSLLNLFVAVFLSHFLSLYSFERKGIEETDLIEEQVDFWNEGSSIDLVEESRYGTSIDYQHVEKHIIKDVTFYNLVKLQTNQTG